MSVEASLLPLGRYEVVAGAIDRETRELVGELGRTVFRILPQKSLPALPEEIQSQTYDDGGDILFNQSDADDV